MGLLRSDRLAAGLLLAAAALGLILANSPASGAATAIADLRAGSGVLGLVDLDLSLGEWISDGLLAVFFFLAAVELRHEFRHGELDSPRKAVVPAAAAVAGVIAPALIFVSLVADPELRRGWPIPTATDIAFALGILAIAGRALPPRIRATLLALAVIDDLIAIVLIAVLFTDTLDPVPLIGAAVVVAVFGALSRLPSRRWPRVLRAVLVLLALLAWGLVNASGVHPTVAGVALGLAMSPGPASRARDALTPWSNVVVLPLFALSASLVAIPAADGLGPVVVAIAVALPVGKLIGIGIGATVASRLAHPRGDPDRLPLGDIAVVATLGGIGFTVSLLMNELAFGDDAVGPQGTLAVLVGSAVAMLAGLVVTGLRARGYRLTRLDRS